MTSGQYPQVAQLSGGISQATNRIHHDQELCTLSLLVVVKYTNARCAAH